MVLHNSVLHMNMMNNLACILYNFQLCCYFPVYAGPDRHLQGLFQDFWKGGWFKCIKVWGFAMQIVIS